MLNEYRCTGCGWVWSWDCEDIQSDVCPKCSLINDPTNSTDN
jgi:hypothetical protein